MPHQQNTDSVRISACQGVASHQHKGRKGLASFLLTISSSHYLTIASPSMAAAIASVQRWFSWMQDSRVSYNQDLCKGPVAGLPGVQEYGGPERSRLEAAFKDSPQIYQQTLTGPELHHRHFSQGSVAFICRMIVQSDPKNAGLQNCRNIDCFYFVPCNEPDKFCIISVYLGYRANKEHVIHSALSLSLRLDDKTQFKEFALPLLSRGTACGSRPHPLRVVAHGMQMSCIKDCLLKDYKSKSEI